LLESIILSVQTDIFLRQFAAGTNDGNNVSQPHERCAKPNEHHAEFSGRSGRLTDKNDTTHHQQSNDDPVLSFQSDHAPVCGAFLSGGVQQGS
jgi:hypothetical protein